MFTFHSARGFARTALLQRTPRSLANAAILRSNSARASPTGRRSTSSSIDNLFRRRHADRAHDRAVEIFARRISGPARFVGTGRVDVGSESRQRVGGERRALATI